MTQQDTVMRDLAEHTLDGRGIAATLTKVRELSRVFARDGFSASFAETLGAFAADRCLQKQTDASACRATMARLADGLLAVDAPAFGSGLRQFHVTATTDPRRAPHVRTVDVEGSAEPAISDRRPAQATADGYTLLECFDLAPGCQPRVFFSATARTDLQECFVKHPRYDASKHAAHFAKAISGTFMESPRYRRAARSAQPVADAAAKPRPRRKP